jgi:hypothetical protein
MPHLTGQSERQMRKMTDSNNDYEGDPPLDTAAAAKFTGLAVATLAKLRCIGGGPAYLKLGRKVVYRAAGGLVRAWQRLMYDHDKPIAMRGICRTQKSPPRNCCEE